MNNLLKISKETLLSFQIVDWSYTEDLEPTTYKEYLKWVEQSHHGPLNYLADHRMSLRANLKNYDPNCQSALVFLFDYRSTIKKNLDRGPKFKIASYTTGFGDKDYHFWIKEKLELIASELKLMGKELEYKLSLDIHPVLERDLAYRSGLGWFGKNSMLINREFGSYQLIGSILLNKKLSLNKKELESDHCGTCTKCIQACPTNAILPDLRSIDARKCISTFTIETFKDATPPKGFPVKSKEVFGCDICQQVCPWNDKALKGNINKAFSSPLVDFFDRELEQIIEDIKSMSNKKFKVYFKETSFERVGKKGLLKNLKYYL